ncbi:MAG: YcgL domain-containing protein, partial [Aeromonas sp.]
MLCAVYKSHKKAQTYLFVEKRDDFSRVPAPLLVAFGRPALVLMTKLDPLKPLAMAD